ncbi:MAG TPA: TetR/AcrR family transcriptional regulator [Candidatus Izemoplasmatales bacterium]|nr:TetR/AcrR family transcriptional regulator [Candidatus Izemoplasmatales bacterium]
MGKDKTQLLIENQKVFEETLNEFSEKSYDLASVNEIIKRSRYNKGSFYYRFKDKRELYISLLDYVFVKQIESFKTTGFSLITNNHIKDIVIALLQNLVDVYGIDQRFYHLIQHFYNEKDIFVNEILSLSVGSLYERFKTKLKHMDDFNETQTVLLESLYKNLPIKKILGDELNVSEMASQLIGCYRKNSVPKLKEDIFNGIKQSMNQSINYLITNQPIQCNHKEFYYIFEGIDRLRQIKRRMRYISHQFKFNLVKILEKFQFKPIFNPESINRLLTKNIYRRVESDPLLFNILISYVYGIIDLKPYILCQVDLDKLSNIQLDLLLNIILPINGQLSKMIVMSQSLVFNGHDIKTFYIHNPYEGFHSFHFDELKEIYYQKYHCQYIEEGVYKDIYVDTFNQLTDLVSRDIELLDMKLIHHMHINDLKKVVNKL